MVIIITCTLIGFIIGTLLFCRMATSFAVEFEKLPSRQLSRGSRHAIVFVAGFGGLFGAIAGGFLAATFL